MPRFDSRYRRRVLDEWKSSQDEAATRLLAAIIEQRQCSLSWLDRLKAGFAAVFGPLRTTAEQ